MANEEPRLMEKEIGRMAVPEALVPLLTIAPHNVIYATFAAPRTPTVEPVRMETATERSRRIYRRDVEDRDRAEAITGFGGTEPINSRTGIATTIF